MLHNHDKKNQDMKTFQQKKTPSLNALTYIDIPFKIHTI